jgi:hypothetical protein
MLHHRHFWGIGVASAPRRYVASICMSAPDSFRPFRLVRAGGTNPLTSGNTCMLFTVVEKHARDSRALRIRLNARDSWEQGCCPRGPSVVIYPPACPRDVVRWFSQEASRTARLWTAASRSAAVIGTTRAGSKPIRSALGRPPRGTSVHRSRALGGTTQRERPAVRSHLRAPVLEHV